MRDIDFVNARSSEDEKAKSEDEKAKVEVKQTISRKKESGRVLAIKKGQMIVEDSKGNGVTLPFTSEYLNVKIGETVYF